MPLFSFEEVPMDTDLLAIGIYIADNSARENKKWYDDVVAATSYIGPRVE